MLSGEYFIEARQLLSLNISLYKGYYFIAIISIMLYIAQVLMVEYHNEYGLPCPIYLSKAIMSCFPTIFATNFGGKNSMSSLGCK